MYNGTTPIDTTEAALRLQLDQLSHDLNNEWGIIWGATSFAAQEAISSADRDQFEAMQRRAMQRLQAIVAQLAPYFPRQALVSQLASACALKRGDQAVWSTEQLEQLTPLVDAVKRLLH